MIIAEDKEKKDKLIVRRGENSLSTASDNEILLELTRRHHERIEELETKFTRFEEESQKLKSMCFRISTKA